MSYTTTDEMRKMTVGELLDLLDDSSLDDEDNPNDPLHKVNPVLHAILWKASGFYDDYDHPAEHACDLAATILMDEIDADHAGAAVGDMWLIAYYLLRAGVGLTPETRAALERIRYADDDLMAERATEEAVS